MKQFEEKIKKEAQNIRLSAEEKQAMRRALSAHMLSFPASPAPSPYARLFAPRALVPLLAAALVVGGGTAYAAQGALPGDLLYPIKIHITEPVEVALAQNSEAKAKVEARLAERRVEEAQSLAARGELDATTTAELQTNFDGHAVHARALVEKVKESDPAQGEELSSKLGVSLNASADTLRNLNISTTTSSQKDNRDFYPERHGEKKIRDSVQNKDTEDKNKRILELPL